MPTINRTGVVLVVAALAVVQCSRPSAQSTTPEPRAEVPPAMAQQLLEAIDGWTATPGHHGVSASVVLASGAQWSEASGLAAADEPLRTDHLMLIASITKTMTGALILQLVDEGVVRLEDRVGRWLPPVANVDPGITIRQLLNHTNGLANYTTSAELIAAIRANRSHAFTAAELLRYVGRRRFPAGQATEYTNTAFLLLGMIAERATERPLVDLYHQRLWDPLELTEIFLPAFEEPPGPVAMALSSSLLYDPMAQTANITVGNSAAGLISNARTVAAWGNALFRGSVVSEGMQAAMRTMVPAAGNIPGETGAGLGIRGYQYLDRTQFGHSGGSAMGSSLMLHDPDTGVTVAVVMNQGQGAEHFELAPRLLEIATR
ncbi:MAG: serine hydrolase domain-containing protein [Vicinamibacterales bacterium]